jgi:hypothetical protein
MTMVAGLIAMSVPASLPLALREVETTPVPSNRRTVLRRDPLEHARTTETDAAGRGTKAAAHAQGWFEGRAFSGGDARASFDGPRADVVLREAEGYRLVYVKVEPRAGDVQEGGFLA